MSDDRVAGWLGAEQFVTPVEERIDHEVRRIAGQVGELLNFARGNPVVLSKLHEIIDALERLERIDLLTEHSAREEYQAMGREVYRCREALAQSEVDARWIVGQWQRLKDEPVKEVAIAIVERCQAALALPATESAQPEEER